MDSIKCKQCDGTMTKSKKVDKSMALQLVGVLVFIAGLILLFVFPIGTLFGVVLMIVSLFLGYSKKPVWKCGSCGFFFERIT